jgi:hypothetical protein
VKYRKYRRWRGFGGSGFGRGRGCAHGFGGEAEEAGGFGAGPLIGGPVGAGGGIEIGDHDPRRDAGGAAQPAVRAGEREDRRHRRLPCRVGFETLAEEQAGAGGAGVQRDDVEEGVEFGGDHAGGAFAVSEASA